MRVATPASRRAGQPRGGVTGGPVGFVENLATDDRMLFGTNPDVPDFGGRHFASQDGSLSLGTSRRVSEFLESPQSLVESLSGAGRAGG